MGVERGLRGGGVEGRGGEVGLRGGGLRRGLRGWIERGLCMRVWVDKM